jgi:hypothetical protein
MTRAMIGGLVAVLLIPLATTAVAQPVPAGDSYLCYKAPLAPDAPDFIPTQKTLEGPFGTLVVDVKGIATLCNPTETAAHPAVHAVGYKIAAAKSPAQAKFVKSGHTVVDQFGTHPITLVKPLELRAPSATVLGAGGTGLANTTGVDHFECYRAKTSKGAPKFVAPAPFAVTDAFATQNYTLRKITRFCTPVNKNGEDPTAPQHVGRLVCYQAKLPAGVRFAPQTVSVNNTNFGPAVLAAKAVLELCVAAVEDSTPSTTTTTPPPTTTTLQAGCSVAQPCAGGVQCCAGTCLPPDAFCRGTCSVTTTKVCSADANCRIGQCLQCYRDDPNQVCVPNTIIVPNVCGGGTCLTDVEFCCSAGLCCRSADQVCDVQAGRCLTTCRPEETRCESGCCAAGQACVNGACRESCGSTSCDLLTQDCCSDTCCDAATQFCRTSPSSQCIPRTTCTGTDVYRPLTNTCCSQEQACGTDACCNLGLGESCDTATGQCVLNP